MTTFCLSVSITYYSKIVYLYFVKDLLYKYKWTNFYIGLNSTALLSNKFDSLINYDEMPLFFQQTLQYFDSCVQVTY